MTQRTTVTRTDNDSIVGADVLEKSDRRLKVALDGTQITLTLRKDTPQKAVYVGSLHGLKFTSTGN